MPKNSKATLEDIISTKGKTVGPNKKTKHHMIASSRLSEESRRKLGRTNIKTVEHYKHEAWHYIFNTLTPYEATLLVIMRLAPNKCFVQATIVVRWKDYCYRFKLGDVVDKKTAILIESLKPNFGDSYDLSLRTLFDGRDWCNVVATIVKDWAPQNYFQFVSLKTLNKDGTASLFKFNPPKQKGWKKKERRKRKHT